MTALELIEKEIKKLTSVQLKKIKGYIDNIYNAKVKTYNRIKRKRVRTEKKLFDEYFGLYNYSNRKINSDLKQLRKERERDIELPD